MPKKLLRRYVDLPALIYLLKERKLTLLDPQSWEDRNDSYFLELYRQKLDLQTVLAACFAQGKETYHHWRVFASGTGGVCITFNRLSLMSALRSATGLRRRAITYLSLKKLGEGGFEAADLPFLKRQAFEHENEYRAVYQSETKALSKLDIPIPLSCVAGITLSPWMPSALYATVKKTLTSIDRCHGLKIVRSTLINNDEWKRLGEQME
jgi:hypothetical protein